MSNILGFIFLLSTMDIFDRLLQFYCRGVRLMRKKFIVKLLKFRTEILLYDGISYC